MIVLIIKWPEYFNLIGVSQVHAYRLCFC